MYNIPKVVYYCWFGGEKPQSVLNCINNWKEKLSNYEIIIKHQYKRMYEV